MFCKNRITLIGFIGKDAQTRYASNGTAYTRFSVATNVSWREKATDEYRTRTERHSIVVWSTFGEWAGSLKKGAFVEVEGELRYRDIQPKGSETNIRLAEIHATSILTLDRAEKAEAGESAQAGTPTDDDTPF